MSIQDDEHHLDFKEQEKHAEFLKLVAKSGFGSKIVEVCFKSNP
jgi:hypothetical protein